jgi:flagellar hook-basal body protein
VISGLTTTSDPANGRGVVTVTDPATGIGRLVYEQLYVGVGAPIPTLPVGQVYLTGSGTIPTAAELISPATVPLYAYEQKNSTDGVLVGEALDAAGYVYVQATTANGTNWTGSDSNSYTLRSDGLYYLGDAGTGQSAAAWGLTFTAEPDTTQPVASQRGVATAVRIDRQPPAFATQTAVHTGMGTNSEVLANASTSYTNNTGNNFYERSRGQDGYTYGELRYVTVSQDGVLSGSYSNGVTLELYQIVLYDFPSKQNLRREGGNLFTQTRESGEVVSGAPNTGSFGTTHSNEIEQSNVDLAREFVQMITTQRGFQANSKSITTVDTMLETVIQMKR